MPHIQLLGEVGVSSRDGSIALRSGKELGLVALLAEAHPRPLTRRYILDLLWPESDPDRARRSLNQTVYAIRRSVGQRSLRVRLDLLALNGADWTCDLWDIESLVAEAAANRSPVGRFARGGRLPDTAGFVEWVDRTRARVDAHLVSAYCAELGKLMDRGRFEHVEPLARAALEIDPYAETALYHLAMSVAGSGRITAALQELRSAREKFRSDLDRELPAAFEALARRLESAEAFEALRRPKSKGPQPVIFAFVGREEEFAHLRGAWDRIRETGRRIVMVSGEPGIGKTRLVDRLARLVSIRGGRVLHAECFAAHKRVPFAALSEAMRGLRPDEIAELDAIWRKVLFTSFALEAAGTDLDPPPRLEPAAEQLRLFESVVLAIQATAAARPVLVLIDDLQWLDQSSAAVLQHVMRRCEEDPILFVFAARERELRVDDELREFVANNRGTHFTDIELDVLDEKASEELAWEALKASPFDGYTAVPEGFTRRLGGHPFLITESIHSGFALTDRAKSGRRSLGENCQLTRGLDDYFSSVLSGIRPDGHHLVTTLGAWECAQPLGRLADFLGWPYSRVLKAAENLLHTGIIESWNDTIEFKHGLYRDWIYAKTSIPRRAHLHRMIAEYVSKSPLEDYASAATHYAKAGDSKDAYQTALAAARGFELTKAYPEAEHFLRLATHHAENELTRLEAEAQLADHLTIHSSHRAARAIYDRLVASKEIVGSPLWLTARARLLQIDVAASETNNAVLCRDAFKVLQRALIGQHHGAAAAALNAVTRSLWYGGDSGKAPEALNAARLLMASGPAVIDTHIEYSRLAILLALLSRDRQAAFRILETIQPKGSDRLPPHVLASLAQIEGLVMWSFGKLTSAVDACGRALTAARDGGSILLLTTTLINIAVALHYVDPTEDVDERLKEAAREADKHGFGPERSSAEGNRLLFAWENRCFRRVAEILEAAIDNCAHSDGPGAGVTASVRGLMQARLGNEEQAEQLLGEALLTIRKGGYRCQDPSAVLRLARVLGGRPATDRRARDVAEEIRGSSLVGQVCEWKVGLEWARIAAKTGDADQAVGVVEDIECAAGRAQAKRISVHAGRIRRYALSRLPTASFRGSSSGSIPP